MGILSTVTLPADGASVTVPSGAQIAVMSYAYWTASTPVAAAPTASIGGQSFTSRAVYLGLADAGPCGMQEAVLSGSGSQTFLISYPGGATEGPVGFLSFLDGLNLGDYFRDADATASGTAGGAVSFSLDTATTDIVLVSDSNFSGTAPSNPSGYTSLSTHVNNSRAERARSADSPGGTSTTISAQDVSFSQLTAISIKTTASPPPSGPSLMGQACL